MYGPHSKSSLYFTIDQLKIKHREEMENMKKRLLEENSKVKELEDKFGVTRAREWETRKGSWWMTWLYNNDTDAYEYLLKTIHNTLLCHEETSLEEALRGAKIGLIHVYPHNRNHHDEKINIYGMKLISHHKSWRDKRHMVMTLCNYGKRQTKDDLITFCHKNNIHYKKSWSKKLFIRLLLHHGLSDKNLLER